MILSPEQRQAQWLQKMVIGAAGGESRVATPTAAIGAKATPIASAVVGAPTMTLAKSIEDSGASFTPGNRIIDWASGGVLLADVKQWGQVGTFSAGIIEIQDPGFYLLSGGMAAVPTGDNWTSDFWLTCTVANVDSDPFTAHQVYGTSYGNPSKPGGTVVVSSAGVRPLAAGDAVYLSAQSEGDGGESFDLRWLWLTLTNLGGSPA